MNFWEGPSGAAAESAMRAAFSEAGLSVPLVPREILSQLRSQAGGWQVCTLPDFDWEVAYMRGDIHGAHPVSYLNRRLEDEETWTDRWPGPDRWPTESNYFFLGHTGHGINSYCITLAENRPNVSLGLQVGWGGIYMDAAAATESVNFHLALWARLREALNAKVEYAGMRWLLLLDDYRGSGDGLYVQLGDVDKSEWEIVVSLDDCDIRHDFDEVWLPLGDMRGRAWANPTLQRVALGILRTALESVLSLLNDDIRLSDEHDTPCYLRQVDALLLAQEVVTPSVPRAEGTIRKFASAIDRFSTVLHHADFALSGNGDFPIDEDDDMCGDASIVAWHNESGEVFWLTAHDEAHAALRYKGLWLYGAASIPNLHGLVGHLVPPPFTYEFDECRRRRETVVLSDEWIDEHGRFESDFFEAL